jgi:hypothetical protein
MVTVIDSDNTYSQIGQNFGSGFMKGYMQRADQKALQKAIDDLGPDASGHDIVKAITNAKTYSPESKHKLAETYLGAAEYERRATEGKENRQNKQKEIEEKKRAAEESESLEKIKQAETARANAASESLKKEEIQARKDIASQKALDKAQKDREEVKALYKSQNPKATPEEIESATQGLSPAGMRALVTKPENITEYEVAKNHAKRFEPAIKNINENAEKAKKLIIPTEVAIANNEKYTTGEKYWDAIVGLTDNKFLNLLKSQTGQQLEAYAPIAVSSFSDKMGGVLSVRKINLIEKKAVSPNKDKETNRLFLYMDLYDRKLDLLKQQFTDDLLNENKYGLASKDFNRELDKRMKPYQKQIDKDIGLLLDGKKPKSNLSQIGIIETKKKNAPPGHVFVIDAKGNEGYLQEDLLGKPGYEDLKKYE